ncbi:uncharacterized protein LOC125676547 [Ostrea edulis]|uniref:uncharacterized protein LOC125676547 n=1 Tax=Ostrea edulis TaxID=37623 RepID=UPI0024AFE98D|nr:uncharacterized protein LOC125676547 [Ostrea edulis]
MRKRPCLTILCTLVLLMQKKNGLCYDNDAVELSAVQHIGHKLFHALFGIEKLPICVLCGEDEQQTNENIAIPEATDETPLHNSILPLSFQLAPDVWQYIIYFALGCLGCLLLCSGLLAMRGPWRWVHKGKVEMKEKGTATKRKTPATFAFLLKEERVTGTTASIVKNQHRRHKGASKIQMLFKGRRDVPVSVLDARLHRSSYQKCKQEIKKGKRSGKTALEKKFPTRYPSRDLDVLLCVKPSCQKHNHSKVKFQTESQMEKVNTTHRHNETAANKSRQSIQRNIQVDDIGCLTELGTPLHSSTFVHCNLSHNGSFMESFVDTLSRDELESRVKIIDPCDNQENTSQRFQYVKELERPSFEIHHADISSGELTSFHDHVAMSHDETSSDEKNGSIESTSSFGRNASTSYPSVYNPVNMESSLNASDTSFSGFFNSFQHLARRSPTYVRNALERTTSSARNLVLQAGRSARYVGRKTVEGASGVVQRTGYSTVVFIAQTADDVLYVIECARSGRRCVVRRIHRNKTSLLCDAVKENLDWDVYDYLRVFDDFGDETNTALHLVAAVVVKSAIDKARSCVNRQLEDHSSSFLFNDSFISVQDNKSLNACSDFSYDCLI